MADPISMTLAAAAFIEPAIRAACKAYGLHQLNRSFGPDFKEYCRKLDGQKARMEEWSQWPVGSIVFDAGNDKFPNVVLAELAAMQVELGKCAAIRIKYEINSRLHEQVGMNYSGML